MSGSDNPSRRALVARPGQDYEVGYGKPPKEHQFRKGRSGNPRGRPKGAKNKLPRLNEERMKTIILDEAYRTIKVRDGGREVTVPIAQAVIRALAVNAAKGQHRAQRLFAELLAATETANKALADEWLKTAIDYKADWDEELDRRRRLGITHLPLPVPHPDHVIIDPNTGMASVRGPLTKEQKAKIDELEEQWEMWRATCEELEQDLAEETDPDVRAGIEEDLKHTRRLLTIYEENMPKRVG